MSESAVRRPRTDRSAADAPPTDSAIRRRLADALERCERRERMMLALLLVERLTPAEAARALGLPVAGVTRRYRALLAELAKAYHGLGSRRAARAAVEVSRLRRAS
jgi:DNA-directed RNA polymerase specialized sigma24 family protein